MILLIAIDNDLAKILLCMLMPKDSNVLVNRSRTPVGDANDVFAKDYLFE